MNSHPNFSCGHIALAVTVLLICAPALAGDAAPASAGKPSAAAKNAPVRLEAVPGGTHKRITLSGRAAERLGIQTGVVGEEVVVRKQIVGGMIVYPQTGAVRSAPDVAHGGFGAATAAFGGPLKAIATSSPGPATYTNAVAVSGPAASPAEASSHVIVNLSPGEYARIAKDKPVRVMPLFTRDKGMQEMLATASAEAPVQDAKHSMLALHYVLPRSDHGLAPSTRVRVELQLAGSEEKQMVVPYNAVYYDAKGTPWVYVNTEPLTYQRYPIKVQRVVGDRAVLAEGPAIGTPVVVVGAALLYGTEIYGK